MKKVITVFLVSILFVNNSFAQTNQSDLKVKKTHFGFGFGGNYSLLKSNTNLPSYIKLENSTGFSLGIVGQYELSNRTWLGLKSNLSFNNNQVINTLDNSEGSTPIFNTNLEFMAHATFKTTDKKWNHYIFMGPNFKIPLKVDSTNPFKKNSLGLDLGIGFEKKMPYFNVMPEIRLTSGFTDIGNTTVNFPVYFNSLSVVFYFIE